MQEVRSSVFLETTKEQGQAWVEERKRRIFGSEPPAEHVVSSSLFLICK